jgi:hypothetical protein
VTAAIVDAARAATGDARAQAAAPAAPTGPRPVPGEAAPPLADEPFGRPDGPEPGSFDDGAQ